MGVYLNSKKSGAVYKNMVQSSYFVDKTAILVELIPIVEQDFADSMGAGGKDIRYICVTRPRRFGKTVMASMIASFFGKGEDSRRIFQRLFISGHEGYAILVCEEFSCLEFHMNRDMTNWILIKIEYRRSENGTITKTDTRKWH